MPDFFEKFLQLLDQKQREELYYWFLDDENKDSRTLEYIVDLMSKQEREKFFSV